MIKKIAVEIQSETLDILIKLAAKHHPATVEQIAGQILDAQAAYRLEIDRMQPPPFGTDSPPFGASY